VYAKRSCPAGDPCDLLTLLHGPHRVGCRLVMILLSQHGWSAATIAELLGCDPLTVRRWVHRYNHQGAHSLADRPRAGRPRLGSRRLGDRIRRLLAGPRAWTISRLWQRLGRPAISQRTLRWRARDVAAWRRPRLTAKNHRMPIRSSPVSARPLPSLPEGLVVLAEDATHINHPGSPHRASTHTRPTTPRRHGRNSHHRHPQRQPPQHTSKGRVDPYGGRLLPDA